MTGTLARPMSPTIFRARGLRFFFFSREEERMHVHVLGEEGEAKIWIDPQIEVARSHLYHRWPALTSADSVKS